MNQLDALEPRRLFAGAIHTDFGGGDGRADVKTSTKNEKATLTDYAVDDQGRPVVATLDAGKRLVRVIRLTADGSTDATFGTNGTATVGLPKDLRLGTFTSFDLQIDSSERPVLMVASTLSRLTDTGRTDKTFGGTGRITPPIVKEAVAFDIDAGNRLLIAGTSQGEKGTRATIVRLNDRAGIDRSFGSGGAYKTPVPVGYNKNRYGNAEGVGVRVLDSGEIVGVSTTAVLYQPAEKGSPFNPFIRHSVVPFKLSADGAHATSYAPYGANANDVNYVRPSLLAIRPDGQVLASLHFSDDYTPPHSSESYALLGPSTVKNPADLTPSGVSPKRTEGDTPRIVGIQADSKLLIRCGPLSYRLNTDLTLDTLFTAAGFSGVVIERGVQDDMLSFGATVRNGSPTKGTTIRAFEV